MCHMPTSVLRCRAALSPVLAPIRAQVRCAWYATEQARPRPAAGSCVSERTDGAARSAAPVRQHAEHRVAEVAAGGVVVVPPLQRLGVQPQVVLRVRCVRERARVAVELRALRGALTLQHQDAAAPLGGAAAQGCVACAPARCCWQAGCVLCPGTSRMLLRNSLHPEARQLCSDTRCCAQHGCASFRPAPLLASFERTASYELQIICCVSALVRMGCHDARAGPCAERYSSNKHESKRVWGVGAARTSCRQRTAPVAPSSA